MKEYDILMNKMFLSVNHGEMEKNLVSACTTFIEVFQIKIWYDTWLSNIIYLSIIGEFQIKVQSHEARPFSVSLSRPISCSDPSQCPIFDRIQNDIYTILYLYLYLFYVSDMLSICQYDDHYTRQWGMFSKNCQGDFKKLYAFFRSRSKIEFKHKFPPRWPPPPSHLPSYQSAPTPRPPLCRESTTKVRWWWWWRWW